MGYKIQGLSYPWFGV